MNALSFTCQNNVCKFLLCCGIGVFCLPDHVEAQRNSRNRGPNVTDLDRQAKMAQEDFLNSSAELASQYEEIGELEKAQEILKKMLKLNPDAKQIQDKIDDLDEVRIAANEMLLQVDGGDGWKSANVGVKEGNVIRFESDGEVRIILNQTVGPDGVESENVKTDLAKGVPLGALMGLIVDGKGESGEPFAIGRKTEMDAPKDGQLFLRINAPPGAKCLGKVKVRITGDIVIPETESSSRRRS